MEIIAKRNDGARIVQITKKGQNPKRGFVFFEDEKTRSPIMLIDSFLMRGYWKSTNETISDSILNRPEKK